MEALSGQVWVILGILSAGGGLVVLHSLAAAIRNDTYVHDLRVKVNELRVVQMERLRVMAERAMLDGKGPKAKAKPEPRRKAG